ncbi:MAG: YheT family hydrolase [Bdellovibrionales bacterium]
MKLEPCDPPVWASTGHAQTILGYLLPSPRLRSKGRRVEIPLEDGDRLVGFVEPGESKTVTYIFHGLAGSTDSSYVHRTSILAQRMGHTVFITNHRGCGEGLGYAKAPYHSGRAEDLAAVIEYGRRLFPGHRHLAIGFSLSGNALLLLQAGRRGQTKPDAAVSVNAPIHLARTAVLLRQGLNRIYDAKFYRQCRRDILRGCAKEDWHGRIPWWATLHDFDNFYTAPAGGFANREDYYLSCSTHNVLGDIATPTVVLTAADDPFVPVQSFYEAQVSEHVLMHIEPFGGHMGYLSRQKTPFGTRRWQDYALSVILREI